jgi:hypothetical protein
MRQILIIAFSVLSYSNCIAENIDGPANIRANPQGKIIFSLEDNEYVYAYELEDNWYKIMVTAMVKLKDLKNDTIIKPNVKLYNYDFSTEIGIVKSELNIADYFIESGDSEFVEVMIYGFTFKSNIKPESVLEREIERAIEGNNIKELSNIYDKFNFYQHELEKFNVWTTYEGDSPWGSSDFRMIIYCDKNDQIIGVASKKKNFKLNCKSESTIDRNYRMLYLIDMSEIEKRKFEDYMTKAFAMRD